MDSLIDTTGLKAHVKASKLAYKDAVIDYFRLLGEKHGFTTLTNTPAIANATDYGRIDLVWVEPNIIFMSEFGIPEDPIQTPIQSHSPKPSKTVIILSSKSRCTPKKAKEIIEKTPELKGMKYEIIDAS